VLSYVLVMLINGNEVNDPALHGSAGSLYSELATSVLTDQAYHIASWYLIHLQDGSVCTGCSSYLFPTTGLSYCT